MRRLAWLSLLVAGCASSSDPCSGKSGACIGLRVVGAVTGLDQLAFNINAPGTSEQRTPNPPKSFTLPIKVALFPPAGTSGTVHVSADGWSSGLLIAHGEVDAPLINGRAQETLTLSSSSTAEDLSVPDLAGVDLVGTSSDLPAGDLSACATVTTCKDGDGCCPSNCNNSNDKDCVPVCGNGVVETGEVCDDGNTVNGDGCDPTCQWFGIMTTLSGKPGAAGYANGSFTASGVERFGGLGGGGFGGMASDGTKLWLTDWTNTIRQMTIAQGGNTTTALLGAVYQGGLIDGDFAIARLNSASPPLVYLTSNQKLYFSDAGAADASAGTQVLREVDLTNHTVTTLSTSVVKNNPQTLATDGTTIFYLGGAGELDKWTPGDSSSTQIVDAATITGVSSGCRGIVRSQGKTFLGCSQYLVQVTDAGAVTRYAGSNGVTPCTDSLYKANAIFDYNLNNLHADNGGNLFVSSCSAVRQVAPADGGVTTVVGQLKSAQHDWLRRRPACFSASLGRTALLAKRDTVLDWRWLERRRPQLRPDARQPRHRGGIVAGRPRHRRTRQRDRLSLWRRQFLSLAPRRGQ